MRRLMWFSVGFGSACALSLTLLWKTRLWVIGLAICALALIAALLFRKSFAPSLLLGLGVGFFWLWLVSEQYLAPLGELDGTTQTMTVTLSDYPSGKRTAGRVSWGGKTYRVLVYGDDQAEYSPGDKLTSEFRIRVTSPGAARESSYYQGEGYFLVFHQKGDVTREAGDFEALRYLSPRLGHWIRGTVKACIPGDAEPFARALLLGDTEGLSYEADTALKVSGIRHVAAVSGLHVGMLFAAISFLTGRKKLLTALLGIPALLLFAAVAGFTPSVTRACIMVGLMMAANLFSRQYDSPTALSAAVLVLLITNPLCLCSVSFQLSVASVAGILMFGQRFRASMGKCLEKLPRKGISSRVGRWIVSTAAVSLSAMVFTVPLSAYYFGTISLVSVITNVLTLWVVTLVFFLLAVVCILAAFSLSAGMLVGKLAAIPIRCILAVASGLARFPLAAVYTDSVYICLWLALCYLMLAWGLLRKKPWLPLTVAAVGLCAAVTLSWWLPGRDDFRVTVLDVGQGQCILLQSKGKNYLVDCGGDSDTRTADIAARRLLSQGIFRLDGIVITHCDRDHCGGVLNLLGRVETDSIYLPAKESEEFRRELGDRRTVRPLAAREDISAGSGTISLFPASPGSTGNENSMCVLFAEGKCGILITGDRSRQGEKVFLRSWDLPEVTILVAGHHGAKNSTSNALLSEVRPDIVVISVGEHNLYGHPAPELLERLAEFGCAVFRTDEQGTFFYRR